MTYEEVLTKVLDDDEARRVPVLFITQVVSAMSRLFVIKEKEYATVYADIIDDEPSGKVNNDRTQKQWDDC